MTACDVGHDAVEHIDELLTAVEGDTRVVFRIAPVIQHHTQVLGMIGVGFYKVVLDINRIGFFLVVDIRVSAAADSSSITNGDPEITRPLLSR